MPGGQFPHWRRGLLPARDIMELAADKLIRPLGRLLVMRKSVAKTRTKTVLCYACNEPMVVGLNARNAQRCSECGVKAHEAAVRQIHARDGEAYDKWIAGMAKAMERLTRTPPPPVDSHDAESGECQSP